MLALALATGKLTWLLVKDTKVALPLLLSVRVGYILHYPLSIKPHKMQMIIFAIAFSIFLMLMAQVFVKRFAYRFVLQDKAVGGFSANFNLENYLVILAKEAIAISKPTGLLTNDIKRKIKPSNSQIPLKITLVKS
jgi:hypothetical protein